MHCFKLGIREILVFILFFRCLEHEKRREDLDLKVRQLRRELGDVQQEYDRLMVELTSLDTVKEEEHVRT